MGPTQRFVRKPRTSKAGFTLVELLVVIGIIALLISVLLPSLNKARASARDLKCLSNLHQLGIAMTIYSQQWKNVWPLPSKLQPQTVPEVYWHRNFIYAIINNGRDPVPDVYNTFTKEHEYIKGTIFQCPSAPDYVSPGIGASGVSLGWTITSYGMNARLNDDGGGSTSSRSAYKRPSRIVSPSNASSACLLIDNTAPWAGVNVNITAPYNAAEPDNQLLRLQTASYRHKQRLNTLFCDMHAATLRYDEIPTVAPTTSTYNPLAADWYKFWAGRYAQK